MNVIANRQVNQVTLPKVLAVLLWMLWGSPQVHYAQTVQVPGLPEQSIEVPSYNYNYTHFTPRQYALNDLWLRYNAEYAQHPDAGFNAPWQPAGEVIELLEYRSETTRRFVDARNPSKIYAQSSYSPLHYQQDGKWLTIDHRLNQVSQHLIEAGRQPEPVGFDLKATQSYIRIGSEPLRFNQWKLFGLRGSTKELIAEASWKRYTAGDDGIYITDLFPGIDAEMQVGIGEIKTNLIVKSWDFARYDELIFEDAFDHPDGVILKPAGDNEIDLIIQAHKKARIGRAVAYGLNGGDHHFLSYRVGESHLGIRFPFTDLLDMLAKGPVVIDPLVTGTQSQYIVTNPLNSFNNSDCSDAFNEACSYTWQVEVPGAITVTDLTFVNVIRTDSPCTRDKMIFKYRFGDGTCGNRVTWETQGKPATPGVTGGELTRTSFYNSCIEPGCQTTFTQAHLSILRMCMGDEGCGSNCVSGLGPFIVTVEGHTVELNTLRNLTSSSGYICHAEEVELEAIGEYGVSPYTYRWSPGNLSGEKIRVRPEQSTTYTVTMTDGCQQTATREISVQVSPPMRTDTLKFRECGQVEFEGDTYTGNRSWERVFQNRMGCDSLTQVIDIVVFPLDPRDEKIELRNCEFVEFEGQRYTENTVQEETFRNVNGCDSVYRTVTIQVETFQLDLSSSVPLSVLYAGDKVDLTATGNVNGFRIISWEPPEFFADQSALMQTILAPENQTFTVTAETPTGCRDTATLHVAGKTVPLGTVYPTSFTPNGDGNNDTWGPVKTFNEIELWVYNRWGECIYHTTDSNHQWDGTYNGKRVAPGSYVYRFVVYGKYKYSGVVHVLY